jgi:hypothetical protein
VLTSLAGLASSEEERSVTVQGEVPLAAERIAKKLGKLIGQMYEAAAAHTFEMQMVVAMLTLGVLINEVAPVCARQLANRAALGQRREKAEDRAFPLAVRRQPLGDIVQRQPALTALAQKRKKRRLAPCIVGHIDLLLNEMRVTLNFCFYRILYLFEKVNRQKRNFTAGKKENVHSRLEN